MEQRVEAAYAAAFGKITWESFLKTLVSTLPDGRAALIVHNNRNMDGYGIYSHGAEIDGKYNGYYAQLNPLQPRLAAKPIGFAGVDIQLLPRDELEQTEFYNDFLVPNRMRRTAGVKFAESYGEFFSLVVGCDSNFFGDESFREILGSVDELVDVLIEA